MILKLYNADTSTFMHYDLGKGRVKPDKYSHAFLFEEHTVRLKRVEEAPRWTVYDKKSENDEDDITLHKETVAVDEVCFPSEKLRGEGFQEGDIYRATLLFLYRDKYGSPPDYAIAVPWNHQGLSSAYLLDNETGKTTDTLDT